MNAEDLVRWDTNTNEWWAIATVGPYKIFKCQRVYHRPSQGGPNRVGKYLVCNESIPITDDEDDYKKRWIIDAHPLLVQCLIYEGLGHGK